MHNSVKHTCILQPQTHYICVVFIFAHNNDQHRVTQADGSVPRDEDQTDSFTSRAAAAAG